tara:strand:- start:1032 stop:1655 length:624 start_codon:yes stop_codon:yes gene_type:complete
MSGIIAQNAANATGLIKAAAAGGAWTKIKTLTASSSATLSFVDGSSDVVLDNTYPIYVFEFISLHPATDGTVLTMNASADTGSNYNVTKTTTYFESYQNEAGSSTALSYNTGQDIAQGTGFFNLQTEYGTDNDQAGCGQLWLFNPSSTTYVKHFLFRGQQIHKDDASQETFGAGYFNTTSAVDAVQFKLSSGNIDAGTIKLYGLKDS